MDKPKKKSQGLKWILLYGLMGVIDIVQAVSSPTGIPVAADPFIGAGLLFIFQFIFKINMITKPARIISILIITGLDALSFGVAPLWIADVWWVRRDVRKEEVEQDAQRDEEEMLSNVRQPLHDEDGVRRPRQPYSTDQGQQGTPRPSKNGIRPHNIIDVDFRRNNDEKQREAA